MDENKRKLDYANLSNMLVDALDIPDGEKAKLKERLEKIDGKLIVESALRQEGQEDFPDAGFGELLESLERLDDIWKRDPDS